MVVLVRGVGLEEELFEGDDFRQVRRVFEGEGKVDA